MREGGRGGRTGQRGGGEVAGPRAAAAGPGGGRGGERGRGGCGLGSGRPGDTEGGSRSRRRCGELGTAELGEAGGGARRPKREDDPERKSHAAPRRDRGAPGSGGAASRCSGHPPPASPWLSAWKASGTRGSRILPRGKLGARTSEWTAGPRVAGGLGTTMWFRDKFVTFPLSPLGGALRGPVYFCSTSDVYGVPSVDGD